MLAVDRQAYAPINNGCSFQYQSNNQARPENLTGLVPVKSNPVVIRGLADGATCVPNVSVNQPDVHGGPDNIPIALTLACNG